jgi:hypothetical protein
VLFLRVAYRILVHCWRWWTRFPELANVWRLHLGHAHSVGSLSWWRQSWVTGSQFAEIPVGMFMIRGLPLVWCWLHMCSQLSTGGLYTGGFSCDALPCALQHVMGHRRPWAVGTCKHMSEWLSKGRWQAKACVSLGVSQTDVMVPQALRHVESRPSCHGELVSLSLPPSLPLGSLRWRAARPNCHHVAAGLQPLTCDTKGCGPHL